MIEEKLNKLRVNPKLFKEQNIPELNEETYYAYLESIEQIDGNFHLKYDCIIKAFADNFELSKETILELPSIIIEISGESNQIKSLINYSNLYLLESNWMIITTALRETSLIQEQFYNFIRISNPQQVNYNYDLDKVILYRDMDSASKIKVNQIVNATTIQESSQKEVTDFLDNLSLDSFSHVNIYDVGQGNCTALVNKANVPLFYFDVGGGCGANARTYPVGFKVCVTKNPCIILSHWDQDHIQTAVFDSRLLNSKWLVPVHSSISATAMHIAQALINNGNLICWNKNLSHYDFSNHRIVKCTGNPNNKNNSGLALFVSYTGDEYVLLPGDATFTKISNHPNNCKIMGLLASHHGARGSIRGLPSAYPPSMLAYSYGDPNTHGHAHTAARNAYVNQGWSTSIETKGGHIAMHNNLVNAKVPCKGGRSHCSLSITQSF